MWFLGPIRAGHQDCRDASRDGWVWQQDLWAGLWERRAGDSAQVCWNLCHSPLWGVPSCQPGPGSIKQQHIWENIDLIPHFAEAGSRLESRGGATGAKPWQAQCEAAIPQCVRSQHFLYQIWVSCSFWFWASFGMQTFAKYVSAANLSVSWCPNELQVKMFHCFLPTLLLSLWALGCRFGPTEAELQAVLPEPLPADWAGWDPVHWASYNHWVLASGMCIILVEAFCDKSVKFLRTRRNTF